MKKIKKILFVLAISGSVNAFADSVCVDQHGTLRCGAGSVNEINYRGVVDVDGTTVLGTCRVLGNADIQNSHLNSVFVRGVARLDDTSIKKSMEIIGNVRAKKIEVLGSTKIVGDLYGKYLTFSSTANIVGTLNCDHCIFKNDTVLMGDIDVSNSEILGSIVLNAKTSSFSSAKLNDILVKKPSDDEKQVIQLKNGSVVHNISFESQEGIVVLNGDSKITGTVEGGKVVTR